LEKLDSCIEQTKQGAGLFYASNFSVGVNVFFEINKKLAQLMAPYSDYKVEMEEIHHTEKLDSNTKLGNFVFDGGLICWWKST
jgi:4-hydroxy-tetrahydrodipicolinate reductase